MGGRVDDRMRGAWRIAALALALGAMPASGQVFDLPPGDTPRPPVIGPTDPETPYARPAPVPQPPAETAPSTPVETPAPLPPVSSTAAASPPRAEQTPTVAPERTVAAPPVRQAAPLSPVEPPSFSAAAPPVSNPPDAATASPATPEPVTAPAEASAPTVPAQFSPVEDNGRPWLWALLAGTLALAAIAGWFAWRNDRGTRPRRVGDRSIQRVAPDRRRTRQPAADVPAPDPAADQPAHEPQPALALTLEATRMSATLLNATLSYRLVVANQGPEPLTNVVIAGDMVAAHASRSADELLGANGVRLPTLHRVLSLAPGISTTISGEIRLPLSAITPIRQGDAALFVPIARIRGEGEAPGGKRVMGGGTFVVGQPAPKERLQPFRLDLGPRLYSRVGQHQLPIPA